MGSSMLDKITIKKTVGRMDIYVPSPASPNSCANIILMMNSRSSPANAVTIKIKIPL